MNIKKNSHYQKTHSDIATVVLTLLEEKELRSITVSEVCRILSINRSTFYEHFQDVYDVVERAETAKAENLKELFVEGLTISKRQAYISIFSYIEQNQKFYSIYMNQGKTIHFADIIALDTSSYNDVILSDELTVTTEQIEYYYEFFKAGMNALIKKWLAAGCDKSAEEMFLLMKQQFEICRIVHV